MNDKRKICVVTGSRADYGHLYWLMKEIQNDDDLELQIIVTGMHLSPEFGMTFKQIIADGFHINDNIEMLLSSDSSVGVTKSIGLGVIGFADSLAKLKPDVLVVLGDRFEILAAAQAAMIAKIPLAHLHGGEATYGAFDESIRNAITKMSHLHFVAAQEYANRVLQMGENPKYVFNFGAPGLDYLSKAKLHNRENFEQSIDFKLGEINFLITYHPSTLSDKEPKYAIEQLLCSLNNFKKANIIFTMPNADVNGKEILTCIRDFVSENKHRSILFDSLGQERYLSAISHVDVVIGNSSSGLTEVPYFKKPTVNIGTRQDGRICPQSVILVEEDSASITRAIELALSPVFKERIANLKNLKNIGNISKMIKETLKETDLSKVLIKRFHNYTSHLVKNSEVKIERV